MIERGGTREPAEGMRAITMKYHKNQKRQKQKQQNNKKISIKKKIFDATKLTFISENSLSILV